MTAAQRAAEAAAVLARAGVAADVTVAGQASDIAAVRAPADRLHDIATQADAIRALGFRYVAIELASRTGSVPD